MCSEYSHLCDKFAYFCFPWLSNQNFRWSNTCTTCKIPSDSVHFVNLSAEIMQQISNHSNCESDSMKIIKNRSCRGSEVSLGSQRRSHHESLATNQVSRSYSDVQMQYPDPDPYQSPNSISKLRLKLRLRLWPDSEFDLIPIQLLMQSHICSHNHNFSPNRSRFRFSFKFKSSVKTGVISDHQIQVSDHKFKFWFASWHFKLLSVQDRLLQTAQHKI